MVAVKVLRLLRNRGDVGCLTSGHLVAQPRSCQLRNTKIGRSACDGLVLILEVWRIWTCGVMEPRNTLNTRRSLRMDDICSGGNNLH